MVLDWLSGKKRKLERARKRELAGELEAAADAFLEADATEEACRVLLLAAESDPSRERRMALYARVTQLGGAHAHEAARRRALLAFDAARSGGGALISEMIRIAAELDGLGLHLQAAEAYRLAGDVEGETTALEHAGAIDELEQRLSQASESARIVRSRKELLTRLDDLDLIGERRRAIAEARAWLDDMPAERARDEEAVRLRLQTLSAQLVIPPHFHAELVGARHLVQKACVVLGDTVVIGRAQQEDGHGADIVVHSVRVGRRHLRLFREGSDPMVEDLGSANGTTLAGARVSGRLPIGNGVSLKLAGDVPCDIARTDHGLSVDVAGERHVVPLGPLFVEGWRIEAERDGEDRFVVLTAETGEPPYRGTYLCSRRIELAVGDELAAVRNGPAVLRIGER